MNAMMISLKENPMIHRIGNANVWIYMLRAITICAFLFTTYITFAYIQQPLVDIHAFRQTQTALTSYWILQEGWSLAYQTPVAGFPWSIPFEFPIYQAMVASLAAITGVDLVVVGRFLSYAFLIVCAWPAFAISRRLDLPNTVPWVFCALLWTSPLNVYWGRAFMIETAALFFSLACIPFAIDIIRRVVGKRSVILFIVFASAAVLQKSTTAGPVLLFLILVTLFIYVREYGVSYETVRKLFYPMLIIGIPLTIGLVWAHYADLVKMDNAFGAQLTSKSLVKWNFGTLAQKLDFETWRLVLWERGFSSNAGGLLGVLLLLLPWVSAPEHRRLARLSLLTLGLFVLPVLVFTNVHIVHEYYQVACVAFLLAAISIVIGFWLKMATGIMAFVPVMTVAIIISNMIFFSSSYGIVVARSLDELGPLSVQSYKVGRYLRERTRPGTGIIVFGKNYSSEVAFQAQRKSITVPPWFKEYRELWEQPQKYLGELALSAIVICPLDDKFPTMTDIQARLLKEPEWVHETVEGCEILLSPDTMRVKP